MKEDLSTVHAKNISQNRASPNSGHTDTSFELVTFKMKLLLVAMGLGVGLVVTLPIFYYLVLRDDGTHYTSLSKFRSALQNGETAASPGQSVSLRAIIAPSPSDETIYTLKPNLDVVFQNVVTKTNSYGMRGPEISLPKPDNVYRIAILGDSFAFGWGVVVERSFARLLEEKLNQSATSGRRYEVFNLGVPGYSTFQEVADFFDRGLQFKPDAVVVYFVENDFGLPFFLNAAGGTEGAPLMSAVDYARRVWDSEDETAVTQRRFLQSIMDPNRALAKLANKGEEEDFEVFLAVNPGKTWATDMRKLWILRKDKRIRPINLRDELLRIVEARHIPRESLSLPTDPHPSEIKHELLSELLAKYLIDYTTAENR